MFFVPRKGQIESRNSGGASGFSPGQQGSKTTGMQAGRSIKIISAGQNIRQIPRTFESEHGFIEMEGSSGVQSKPFRVRKIARTEEESVNVQFEKKCLKQAQGPNVLKLIDEGSEGELITQFSGVSIDEHLDRARQHFGTKLVGMPLSLFRSLACQLMNGLKHVHGSGILHLDIKLENILLNELGELTIADFGLAECPANGITNTGKFCSPGYRPPELFKNGKPGESTDIYSAGVALYEMLVGSEFVIKKEDFKCFENKASYEAYVAKRLAIVAKIDVTIKEIIEPMLAWDPASRPSVDDVLMKFEDKLSH